MLVPGEREKRKDYIIFPVLSFSKPPILGRGGETGRKKRSIRTGPGLYPDLILVLPNLPSL